MKEFSTNKMCFCREIDVWHCSTCKLTERGSDVYWTVHHFDNRRIKNQLDATYYCIVFLMGLTCFGRYYAQHQELATIMLITTLVVSFCKVGGGSVNVKLWFLLVCVRCKVVCRLVVTITTINPLTLELDIYSLAHHLCKMWIFYEPRRIALGKTRHFVEE